VTLAYLKGKEAESEEAQEHATAAAWRCIDNGIRTHSITSVTMKSYGFVVGKPAWRTFIATCAQ
jgi:hypothetical protein